MSGMVANLGQLFDERRDAWQRPQLRLVSRGGGPFQKRFDHSLGLDWGELGLATGWTLARQGRDASGLPSIVPTINDLSGYSQAPCNLWYRELLAKHSSGPSAPPFQFHMITRLRHVLIMAEVTTIVTLLYEAQ